MNVRLNEELGREYYAALTRLGETLGISSEVTALQIGRFADVLTLEDVPVNQDSIKEQLWKDFKRSYESLFCQQRKRRRESQKRYSYKA